MSSMDRRRAAGAALLALAATGWAAPTRASAAVDPSSTSLLLSITESVYGQSVTASATVTTVPGPPRGDVVFAVDGLLIKANLGASGATIVLPKLLVGSHPVSATFVPQIPAEQQGSTSLTQAWVVSPVRTRLQVRVMGRGARVPTSVEVKAAGDYGTRPTGRVKVVVRRIGTRDTTRVITRLNVTSVALAALGKLRAGAHRLTVTYVGDSQHRPRTYTEKFSVRR